MNMHQESTASKVRGEMKQVQSKTLSPYSLVKVLLYNKGNRWSDGTSYKFKR